MIRPEAESIRSYLQGKQVVVIDQPQIFMCLVDGHVVLVEYKHGVMVNGDVTRQTCDLLEQELVGDYSWVVNREHDYTIDLVATYNELNARARLKKIAVVSYRRLTDAIVAIEMGLCRKDLSVFNTVEAALVWASNATAD